MAGLPPVSHVILAVDAARKSGWAIWHLGDVLAHGKCLATDAIMMASVCSNVVEVAGTDAKAVMVIEFNPHLDKRRPLAGGRLATRPSARTATGLAARVGAWEIIWRQSGGHQNKIIRVTPNEWRKPVLGITRGDAVHARERAVAARHLGEAPESQDQCAAICIGYWASYAPRARKKVPEAKGRT